MHRLCIVFIKNLLIWNKDRSSSRKKSYMESTILCIIVPITIVFNRIFHEWSQTLFELEE